MSSKTPARSARAPAGRKVVRVRKTAKATTNQTAEPAAKTTKVRKTKAAVTATEKKPVLRTRANARTPRMDGARSIENRILGDDAPRAPIAALLERVSGAIEDELNQIENMVSGRPMPLRQHGQAERRARMLASLARTLREVMQLRAGEEKTQRDDDAVPRDINELRHELARRLERIVAETTPCHSGATE